MVDLCWDRVSFFSAFRCSLMVSIGRERKLQALQWLVKYFWLRCTKAISGFILILSFRGKKGGLTRHLTILKQGLIGPGFLCSLTNRRECLYIIEDSNRWNGSCRGKGKERLLHTHIDSCMLVRGFRLLGLLMGGPLGTARSTLSTAARLRSAGMCWLVA